MKSFFTKIFFAFLITVGVSQLAEAQVYIWGGPGDANSEFAGGLNDWTTTENNGTFWRWDENGMADEGSYWGSRGPMESPSVANGIVLFDSDKFNSVDGIGYPHLGELTSPVFSCENNSTVFVVFNQEARWWQSDNRTVLQVSTDDGNTWLPADGIDINPDIPGTNFASFAREDRKLINITEYAANASAVQIRFVWDGAYYFWLLDDVYVIEQPEVDLEVSAVLYDPISAQVPVSQLDGRFSSFEANVNNQGSMDVDNAVAKIEIVNSGGQVLWADSLTDVAIAAGDTTELIFENLFLASDAIGQEGIYRMRYSVYADGVEEVNLGDNFHNEPFEVTSNYYSNAYYGPSNAWGLDEVWGPYSIFHTGSWAESVPSGNVVLADTVRMAMTDSGANGGDFVADVNVYLYRVSDEVDDDFSNFEKAIPPQFDPADDAHPQLEFVGFAFESSFQGSDYDEFQLEMYNLNFDRQVQLQPNSKYMLLAVWDNDNRIYHVADPGTFRNSTAVSGGWLWDSDTDGVLDWDTDPWYGWSLGMFTAFGVNNNEVVLQEGAMETYPNPADNDIFVDINIEEWTGDATLVISDMQNHYIDSKLVKQGSTRESMSVKNLPAGNYIMTLITNEGVATKKIIVSH